MGRVPAEYASAFGSERFFTRLAPAGASPPSSCRQSPTHESRPTNSPTPTETTCGSRASSPAPSAALAGEPADTLALYGAAACPLIVDEKEREDLVSWCGGELSLFPKALARVVVSGYVVAMNRVARDFVCVSGVPGTPCDWRICMLAAGVGGRVVYGSCLSVRRAGGYACRLGAALAGGGRRCLLPGRPAGARVTCPGQSRRTRRLRRRAAQAPARQVLGPVDARRASPFVLAQRSLVRHPLHWLRMASACPLCSGNLTSR